MSPSSHPILRMADGRCVMDDSRFSSIRELAGTLPEQVDFIAVFSAVLLILTFDSNCVLGDGSYIVATF